MNVATVAPFLAAALVRADAMRILVLLPPTIARFAPSAASASAAANPMPLVAPVIRICLSFTAQKRSPEQHGVLCCRITAAYFAKALRRGRKDATVRVRLSWPTE